MRHRGACTPLSLLLKTSSNTTNSTAKNIKNQRFFKEFLASHGTVAAWHGYTLCGALHFSSESRLRSRQGAKLSFYPMRRPMRHHRSEGQNFQDFPWSIKTPQGSIICTTLCATLCATIFFSTPHSVFICLYNLLK